MLFERLEELGYALSPGVVPEAEVMALIAAIERPDADLTKRGGQRNVLDQVAEARQFAASSGVRGLAAEVLGPRCFIVRSILFDKNPVANWKVSWHQDLAIAVRDRIDVPGFEAWSEKAGVAHVQPPAPVLEAMVTVRIHLDDCGADNGPLNVIAGSHRFGRLTREQIEEWRNSGPITTLTARRGDALVMRPLLLHASSAASRPAHRRVLHLEFAAAELPSGLQWHWHW